MKEFKEFLVVVAIAAVPFTIMGVVVFHHWVKMGMPNVFP